MKQFHGDGHEKLFVLFSEMNRFAQWFRLVESARNGLWSDYGNHCKSRLKRISLGGNTINYAE